MRFIATVQIEVRDDDDVDASILNIKKWLKWEALDPITVNDTQFEIVGAEVESLEVNQQRAIRDSLLARLDELEQMGLIAKVK